MNAKAPNTKTLTLGSADPRLNWDAASGNDGRVGNVKSQPCTSMLKALADDTRWSLVRELLSETRTVSELSERLDVSQYNVSKHLRILRHAGIVVTEKKGKTVQCRIADSFRKKLSKDQMGLDLGCCSFRFDQTPKQAG